MIKPVFTPFPDLKTNRLLLRRITLEDAPEVFFLRSDDSVMVYINKEKAASLQAAEEFIRRINDNIDSNEAIMWAIALREKPEKLIGNICLWRLQKEHARAELGYVLHPDYWRKGLMKEAIQQVIKYGFEQMELHSLEARINPANIASAAILGSTGFVKEGHFKEDFYFEDRYYDSAVYSRLK